MTAPKPIEQGSQASPQPHPGPIVKSAPLFCSRQILVPLSIAVSLTLVLWLTFASFSELTAPLLNTPALGRYLNNGFCQLMLALFGATLLYALFQALGLQAERTQLGIRLGDQAVVARLWQPWLDAISGRDRRQPDDLAWVFHSQQPPSEEARQSLLGDYLLIVRAEQHRHNFAPISFTIWVLPLLGFIGTVVGITQAIGGLEQSVTPDAALAEGLGRVLGGLAFAFDTTFVGLVLVIPTMLCLLVLRAHAQWLDMHYYRYLLSRTGFQSTP